jgi:hypothetical protein
MNMESAEAWALIAHDLPPWSPRLQVGSVQGSVLF